MSIHESGSSKNDLSKSSLDRSKRDDGNSSNMSAASSLIEDDHIDDMTQNYIGNLIIDLETDLEKDEIQNEQANVKPNTSNLFESTSRPKTISPTPSSGLQSNNTKQNQKWSRHSSNNFSQPPSRTFYKREASSNERGELKMRIARENKNAKSEHKIVPLTNNRSPTTTNATTNNSNNNNINNNNSNYTINFESDSPQASSNGPQQSISSKKECGTSTSVGTITEPDCLGPCEPGTSVTLEGIVWQETEGGILVVNVTWRGKTYVGALLDCTKHDWAPPRLCDSPASDIDVKTLKGVRSKRIVTRSNGIGTGLDEKNLLQTTGKLRNGKGRRILNSSELASSNKKQRESSQTSDVTNEASQNDTCSLTTNSEAANVSMNTDVATTSNNANDCIRHSSPVLIGCNEPDCSKKYRNMNGLLYHQTYAHGNDVEPANGSFSEDIAREMSPPKDKLEKKSVGLKRTPSPVDSKLLAGPKGLDTDLPSQTGMLSSQDKSSSSSKVMEFELSKDILSSTLGLPIEQSSRLTLKPNDIDQTACSSTTLNRLNTSNPTVIKPIPEISSKSNNLTIAPPPPPPPLPLPPMSAEEGIKPSGTSTGPPPAPHAPNYYFNSSFYGSPIGPYNMDPFGRVNNSVKPMNPPPMNPFPDPAAAAFLSRVMMSQAPFQDPRMLNPQVPKNLPYAPLPNQVLGVPPHPMSMPLAPTQIPFPPVQPTRQMRLPSPGQQTWSRQPGP